MPKPHPREFRDDVVAIARKGEAPIAQLAKDFGISESCLRNWLHAADAADDRPGFLLFVKNKNLSSHLLSFVLIVFWSETSLSKCKQLFF